MGTMTLRDVILRCHEFNDLHDLYLKKPFSADSEAVIGAPGEPRIKALRNTDVQWAISIDVLQGLLGSPNQSELIASVGLDEVCNMVLHYFEYDA